MPKKVNSKQTISLDNFKVPEYQEIVKEISKKIGKRPKRPKHLPQGNWSSQALRVLSERYLVKDDKGKIIETPEDVCYRVAWEIASAEARWGANRTEVKNETEDFYNLLVSKKFLPNSPTLMNAGTGNLLQYSACYVLPVPDSMEGIFDSLKYQALIHKSGGGTGFAFSRLRPKGSMVKSSSGIASGPISFMRIFDAATNEVKQGGKRRGANMGILRVDHPDIMEFIHCKEDGGITNFNISVAITDKFMKAYKKGRDYDLVDPKSGKKVGKLNAKKVFDEIADGAWRTGDPGLIFLDRTNKSTANPVPSLGPVESTNPCITGDTLISTQEGLVRMKEVIESHFPGGNREGGNMAIVIDKRTLNPETTGTIDSHLFRFFDIGEREVYKLTTKSGFEIRATADHKLLTPVGWKEMKELKPGNEVLLQSGSGKFSQNYNLPFAKMSDNFPTKWSRELGQVLGWLIGDGWIRTGDKNCRVGFTFGKDDKELLEYFKKILNSWYGKEIKEVKRVRNTYHLSYHGKKLVDFFLRLGVQPVKADTKRVPEAILTAPKEAVLGFLQGLFTADGTVRDSRKSNSDWIALTSKSKKLLQEVQLLLLQFGIKSRIFDRSRKPRSNMFPYKAKDGSIRSYTTDGILYEVGVFGDFREQFKEEIGFLNKNKRKRLENTRWRFKRRIKDAFVDKVVEIKAYGKERVYDVTEPLSHSIIANGLVVHQCGEQPLYPYDACNLGSIFLNYFVTEVNGKPQVDWEELATVARLSTRFLDNVIEVNPYPLPQISATVHGIRRIGLGVGGWADMLVLLGIPYDSEEALRLGKRVMKVVQDEAVLETQKMAKERGPFPFWSQSIYKNEKPRRNSTVTTIAPTGTISIIAGSSSGIEPLFAIAYQHIVRDKHIDRTLTFINPQFEEMAKKRGVLTAEVRKKLEEYGIIGTIEEIPDELKKIFRTAHEIHHDWHIKTQAVFQEFTENAVSKTINMRNGVTVNDIKKAYLLAWNTDCKGITVFRDGCKDAQVLNLGVKSDKKDIVDGQALLRRPLMVQGATYKLDTPMGAAFITINENEAREPLEIFINVGKAGSDVAAMAEALGRTISASLRFKGELSPRDRAEEIVHQLAGIGGRRAVGFGVNKIRSLPDAVALALSKHYMFKVNGNGVAFDLGSQHNGAKSDLAKAVMSAQVPGPNGNGESRSLRDSDHTMASAESHSTSGEASEPTADGQLSLSIAGDICPSCGSSALVYEEGCSKCYACGHSEC